MDFTLKKYQELLSGLKYAGFSFQSFAGFLESPEERSIILRHDVDARKLNSLRFARIQAVEGIRGTYYFRIVPQSFDESVIREIASLGHEIGYHYETMDSSRGDIAKAYDEFCRNLEIFRKIVPVKTICMHGSPLSRYDNRNLWDNYDYRSLGLIGEPYFDIDFNKVLYLTDTGRRWDGEKVSIRDKVQGAGYRVRGNDIRNKRSEIRSQKSEIRNQPKTLNSLNPEPWTVNPSYHSTNDIINAAGAGKLPAQLMVTFHPQRWTDKPLPWVKELVWQNIKNLVKRFIID